MNDINLYLKTENSTLVKPDLIHLQSCDAEDNPQLHSVEDASGKSIFGFEHLEDGSVQVGCWTPDGEWEVKFVVVIPVEPDNWIEVQP